MVISSLDSGARHALGPKPPRSDKAARANHQHGYLIVHSSHAERVSRMPPCIHRTHIPYVAVESLKHSIVSQVVLSLLSVTWRRKVLVQAIR
jgi:hypothetical protein